MTKDEYIRRFDLGAQWAREFAERFLIETLPKKIKFDIPFGLQGDETGRVKFLGGRLVDPKALRSIEYIEARKMLWVDKKVPVWINMQVSRIEDDATIIEIHLADRLTEDESGLYHKLEGNPPFHILGPSLPHEGWSLARDGKFHLTK